MTILHVVGGWLLVAPMLALLVGWSIRTMNYEPRDGELELQQRRGQDPAQRR